MSYWDLGAGETVDVTKTEHVVKDGFEFFPENTELLALIDEIKWVDNKPEYGGGRYINYRIQVVKPEKYKNRKAYFKLWPNGGKKGVKDDAHHMKNERRMLGAMVANAGDSWGDNEPTDEDLVRVLSQKLMIFKLGYFNFEGSDGRMVEGNKVKGISSKTKGVDDTPAPKAQTQQSGGGGGYDVDDSIPF